MSLPKRYKNIKKELEHKFLYENDLDSIYLLFHIIENEYRFSGLKPKYVVTKRMGRSVRNYLGYRDDRDLIASTIMKIIGNTITRLELSMYIEAYFLGYDNKEIVDEFEEIILTNVPPKALYHRKKLFHEVNTFRMRRLKKDMIRRTTEPVHYFKHNKYFIHKYCDQMIRETIYSINKFLNKQLSFHYTEDGYYISEEQFITRDEINGLYRRIVNNVTRSLNSICKDAVWYGINDRVLSRYQ
ncbi:MAG: hypothetical protein Q4P28_00365 [Tissierellia bacterium]|nr:hypothetical protein [Tissierellia bacterium]